MKKTEATSVRVSQRFSASAERVFDAWLDPDKACKFLFSTPTGRVVRVEIDPRPGGTFTIVDRREAEDVAHVGKYLELERPRRIVFTFSVPKYSDEADRVTIDIRPVGKGCELTLVHEMHAVSADIERSAVAGWTGILEAAAELLPDPEPTCGEGLAQHATVPAKIAPLFAWLGETLELHRAMLDPKDERSQREDEAYARLAASFKDISGLVEAAAAQMAGHRELPMGAHDPSAFGERQLHAFERFVDAQNGLLAILRIAAERDAQMLASMTSAEQG